MGGGHVTRPGAFVTQPDPNDPMTEFYQLVQATLGRSHSILLPGSWAAFRPPLDRPVYAEDMPELCRFYSAPGEGRREVFAPRKLSILHESLSVTRVGIPAALLLTEEASRHVFALQLLPPFAGAGIQIPPMPDCYAGLTFQLTPEDVYWIDTEPTRFCRKLTEAAAGKSWVHHPALEQWSRTALDAAQRQYRRSRGGPGY